MHPLNECKWLVWLCDAEILLLQTNWNLKTKTMTVFSKKTIEYTNYLVSANSFYALLNILHIMTTFWKLSNYINAMYYLLFMIPCIFLGGNLAIQYINVIWSHFSLTLQIVTGDFWTQWKNVLGIINISNTVTPLLDELLLHLGQSKVQQK